MRRLVLSVGLALAGAVAFNASLGAQDSTSTRPGEQVPVDRIVGVVGTHPILWSDVLTAIAQRRSQGLQLPTDSAAQHALAVEVVNGLVDEEVLVQKAQTDTTIKVTDADVNDMVERTVKQVRGQFKTETEFRDALRGAGMGTPDEYRRMQTELARRSAYQQQLIEKLKRAGRIVNVSVPESEVAKSFEDLKLKGQLPTKPATVAFRQIIVAPRPAPAAREIARVKAESLLAEIRRGGDFEQIAKRESMDPSSKDTGGDLGWNRRGGFVKAFEDMAFALGPGSVSPVVETTFGFHVIRVDRVQPAEVKVRHILIRPKIDSADIARARLQADTALALWKGGTPFDSIAARYHDPGEEKGSTDPFERAKLPESYQKAFAAQVSGAYVGPFEIEDKRNNLPKFVDAHLMQVNEAGEFTIADVRGRIRDQLSQERGIRRVIDQLRKETFVAIRLDSPVAGANR